MKKQYSTFGKVFFLKGPFFYWLVLVTLFFSTFSPTIMASPATSNNDGSTVIIKDPDSGDGNIGDKSNITTDNNDASNDKNDVPPNVNIISVDEVNDTNANNKTANNGDDNSGNNTYNDSSFVPPGRPNGGGFIPPPDGGGFARPGNPDGGDASPEGPFQGEGWATTGETILPIATIQEISPNPAKPGDVVTFSGSGMPVSGFDPYIADWEWTSSIDGRLSNQQEFTTSHLSSGIHVIYFRVQDSSGPWSEEATCVLIIINPPVANAGETPYFGWKQKPLLFDGSQSYAADEARIVQYSWDFGDGTAAYEITPTHTYSRVGIFTVKLTVTDINGLKGTTTTTATIVTHPPVARAGGPYYGSANNPVVFNGAKSSDSDGVITEYAWDFGDGIRGTGKTINHTYNENGTYFVMLTVTDDDGKKSTDITYTVITKPNTDPSKPELTMTLSGDKKSTWKFTVISTDTDADRVRYVFYWGDNTKTISPYFSAGTDVSITHTWTTPGLYKVTVYAEDEKNAKSESTEVTVFAADILDLDTLNEESSPEDNRHSQLTTSSFLGLPLASGRISYIITGITIALTLVIAIILFLRRKNYFR